VRPLLGLLAVLALGAGCRSLPPPPSVPVAAAFRLTPYLQRPEPTAVTVVWFSHRDEAGELTVHDGAGRSRRFTSAPAAATALAWADGEPGPALDIPYRHVVHVDGLRPGSRYDYTVRQSGAAVSAQFRSAPDASQAIRLVVFADCETEPESTGVHVEWPAPDGTQRRYPLDQTEGFAANLRAVREAKPDLLLIAGDLVETGGEQRDWEEFWRHLAPLAANVPVVPALGNHEYYGGPHAGGY
jgi:hypothetical protein